MGGKSQGGYGGPQHGGNPVADGDVMEETEKVNDAVGNYYGYGNARPGMWNPWSNINSNNGMGYQTGVYQPSENQPLSSHSNQWNPDQQQQLQDLMQSFITNIPETP